MEPIFAASVDVGLLVIVGGFIGTITAAFIGARKLGPERKKLIREDAKLVADTDLSETQEFSAHLHALQDQVNFWQTQLDTQSAKWQRQSQELREEALRAREEAAKAKEEAAKASVSAATAYTLQAEAEAKLAETQRQHSEERHKLRNDVLDAEASRHTLELEVRSLRDELARAMAKITELQTELAALRGRMNARRATDDSARA